MAEVEDGYVRKCLVSHGSDPMLRLERDRAAEGGRLRPEKK
jgi:hypothetical protein